jgi:hypothetical protein
MRRDAVTTSIHTVFDKAARGSLDPYEEIMGCGLWVVAVSLTPAVF